MKSISDYFSRVLGFSRNAKSFLGFMGLNFVSMGAMQVILGLYILELGYGEDFLGIVVAVRILTIGFLAIPMGYIIERFDWRKLLTATAILSGLSLFLLAFATNKYVLIGAKFLYGSGFALVFVIMGPFLSRSSKKESRDELFSVNFVIMTAARTLGCFLVGILPTFLKGIIPGGTPVKLMTYRYIIVTLGIFSLLAVIPVLLMKTKNLRVIAESDSRGDKGQFDVSEGFKEEKIIKLSFYKMFFGIGSGLITPFFSVFLEQKMGATADQIGIIMFIYRLGIAAGIMFSPYLSKKIGRVKSVGMAQASSLPFLMGIVLLPNFAFVVMSFLLRGTLMNISKPIATNFAMDIAGKSRETVTSSFMRTSKNIARGGGATMAGWIIANYGYMATYVLTFVFYLGSTILFVRGFQEDETREEEKLTRRAA